jgi:hypothetical protein
MKAISLWQPWATLIAIGAKEYETRGWHTNYTGLLAIHAAKHWTLREAILCYEEPFFTVLSAAGVRLPARCDGGRPPTFLPTGCLVAVGRLVDCRRMNRVDWNPPATTQEMKFGDWRDGRYAWRIKDVVKLPGPVPWVGKQGLFDVPDDFDSPSPAQPGSAEKLKHGRLF